MPMHNRMGPRSNMTVEEMAPFCEVLFRVDDFLLRMEARRMAFGIDFERILRLKRMLRTIITTGCAPYSDGGQVMIRFYLDEFHHYFNELCDRYCHRFPLLIEI
ncbi:unnamed protein product [Caenorhabditis brenneri]